MLLSLFGAVVALFLLQPGSSPAPLDSPLNATGERVAQDRQTPEGTSLSGKPLISAPPTGETKMRLEADLAKAQAD